MIEIIVPDYNDSVIELEIKENTYFFHFQYNSEGDYWALGVMDSEKKTIVAGIKIVANTNIFNGLYYTGIPFIKLYAVSKSDNVGREAFNNKTARLIYAEV
ncbi:phage baseplate plug family protein [Phocoenobacter skyensis]|uniref:Cyanophage baseplate Pam3 plug gp18 domain-containing protein n=1 Tax=Phocoenobacter skyensis TaxID=97481 RepID=A0ABT9JIE2_9PAST|nr:hypothetical protein [Pasteurella skyensis]MDP8078327.1 hypothetical protein [Pasteurella skyensis]MDP8084581.1 hypothetical protein [Pasteurella skyensis]